MLDYRTSVGKLVQSSFFDRRVEPPAEHMQDTTDTMRPWLTNRSLPARATLKRGAG